MRIKKGTLVLVVRAKEDKKSRRFKKKEFTYKWGLVTGINIRDIGDVELTNTTSSKTSYNFCQDNLIPIVHTDPKKVKNVQQAIDTHYRRIIQKFTRFLGRLD